MVPMLALCLCQAESATIGLDFTLAARSKGASAAAILVFGHFGDDFAVCALIGINLIDWNNPNFIHYLYHIVIF